MASSQEVLLKFAGLYPLRLGMSILFGFSGGLFNSVNTALIVPVVLQILGQEVSWGQSPPILRALLAPFNQVPEPFRLAAMLGAVVLTILLKNVMNYASTLTSVSLRRSIINSIREEALEILLEADIDFYSRNKIGDLTSRLNGDISRAAAAVSNYISLVVVGVTLLIFLGVLLSISWKLTLASTLLLGVMTVINQLPTRQAKVVGQRFTQANRDYASDLLEIMNGIRLVKATANEHREFEHIRRRMHQLEQAEFQSKVNSSVVGPITELTSILSLIVIVLLGRTVFLQEVEALSAVMLTYLVVLFRMLPFVGQLNGLRNAVANASSSIDITADLVNRANKPFMPQGAIAYTALQKGIGFEQVSFYYPGSAPQDLVLQEVGLQLPRGQTLALVGSSGAGKSTLADLLARFYDPTAGRITVDGRDLREFNLRSLRRRMGIVSQDTFLFNATVRHNVSYSTPDATDTEIWDALKRANAHEFIAELPQGLETEIGDRGVMLSGGQRQRLAIARALLQNPDILILDEATSALDTVSEKLVQDALEELSRDRTTLVIAHRLSTVKKADQIAVMEKGRVVELGTHDELLKHNGVYRRFCALQFMDQAQEIFHLSDQQKELFSQSSYQFRAQLNAMLGSLNLLADGLFETQEEQNELAEEAYRSAIELFKTVQQLENFATFSLTLSGEV